MVLLILCGRRYTANPPAQVTNTKGAVLLRTPAGFVQGRGSLGEPLASNFSIYDGRVEIEVPDVPGGTEYQIVCELKPFRLALCAANN